MHWPRQELEGDLGSIPRSGRSPGGGIGYPLQHSCLENNIIVVLILKIIFGETQVAYIALLKIIYIYIYRERERQRQRCGEREVIVANT